MAITYTTAVKTARMTAVRDEIDAAIPAGYIEIGTSGMATVLGTITLDTVCGTVTGAVLTFSGFPKSDSSADAAGLAAEARIRDGDATDVITGLTVGTSGADINLDNTNIALGQTITLNSAAITHA